MIDPKTLEVGQKVKFHNDHLWFTVQSRNERYVICNAITKKNTFHTILDLDQEIRGDDNLVFHEGYDNQGECDLRLQDFINGEIEISHRNRVPLIIVDIKECKVKK